MRFSNEYIQVLSKSDKTTWNKGDVLQLMKEFGTESIGKSSGYYGYALMYSEDYDKITEITNIHWHTGNTYIIYYKVGHLEEYLYIPDMFSRMRDLQLRKVIND